MAPFGVERRPPALIQVKYRWSRTSRILLTISPDNRTFTRHAGYISMDISARTFRHDEVLIRYKVSAPYIILHKGNDFIDELTTFSTFESDVNKK